MMAYILLALLALWGLFMVLKPDLLWRIENSDSIRHEQPTEEGLKKIRLGGLACIAGALVLGILYYL